MTVDAAAAPALRVDIRSDPLALKDIAEAREETRQWAAQALGRLTRPVTGVRASRATLF